MKRMTLLVLAVGLISGAAQAALHDRGGGLVYDDVLDVTWLADANYAKTSGYDDDGLMTWEQATEWAASLSYYDSVRGVTYDDWRLPFVRGGELEYSHSAAFGISGGDFGYNVLTVGTDGTVYSELAHMYFNNLGFKSYLGPNGYWAWSCAGEGMCFDVFASDYQPDFGIFGDGFAHWGEERDGLGPNGEIVNMQAHMYWSVFALGTYEHASSFRTDEGYQYDCVSIQDGPQSFAWALRSGDVAAVPEPVPAALFGVGLAGVMLARRRSGAARG